METRNPTHIPARHNRNRSSAGSRRDADLFARLLVWAALGWTISMMVVVLFFATIGDDGQTIFEKLGPLAILLGLVPIAIVSLPLISAVASRVNRITPIVAVVTTFLVIGSIVFAGGFFIPSAFALMAAALLELAERG